MDGITRIFHDLGFKVNHMAAGIVLRDDFGERLCKILGLDYMKVRSLNLVVEPDSVVHVVVDQEVDEAQEEAILELVEKNPPDIMAGYSLLQENVALKKEIDSWRNANRILSEAMFGGVAIPPAAYCTACSGEGGQHKIGCPIGGK